MLRQIDVQIIHHLPSPYGSIRWFKTILGVTLESFHPNPLNNVFESPFLRMFEELSSKIVVSQDLNHNLYRTFPPTNMSKEESMHWYPFLSRKNPTNHQALIVSKMNIVEIMPSPSKVVTLN